MSTYFKKISVIFMVIMLMLSQSACSKVDDNLPKEMTIKQSTFSQETTDILKLFDNELHFFDISLNESAKYETITIWIYKDNQWVEAGNTSGLVNSLDRRIAIRLTDDTYELYSLEDTGHTKYSAPNLETSFKEVMGISTLKIDGETPIELNKEIPILVKIGTNNDYMRVYDISKDFREYECDAGVAITLTISDKEAE